VRNLKAEIKGINAKKVLSIVDRVSAGERLPDIATEFKVGSLKIAKLYVEAALPSIQFANILTDPSIIANAQLRGDVIQMIESDPIGCYHIELMKQCLGREYEELLIDLLNAKHIAFETESDLRKLGKPKTPDILLSVPMATTNPAIVASSSAVSTPRVVLSAAAGAATAGAGVLSSSASSAAVPPSSTTTTTTTAASALDGADIYDEVAAGLGISSSSDNKEGGGDDDDSLVVINWIDSKAMFANETTFRDHLAQFREYNNRYGRGLVIYWHGFVESISSLLIDDLIVVKDHFPPYWMFPTGEPADGRVPEFDSISL
jgi:hypothetical protein